MRPSFLRRSLLLVSLAGYAACSSSAEPVRSTSTAFTAESRERAAVLAAVATPDALATPRIENLQVYGGGAVVAQVSQHIDGIEVFFGQRAVILDRAMRPLLVNGAPVSGRPIADAAFTRAPDRAVAIAIEHMVGVAPVSVTRRSGENGAYARFVVALPPAHRKLVHSARSKPVWWQGKRITAAYYVELSIGGADETDSAMRSFIVTAGSGEVVFENDLVANDSFQYKVYAEPSGSFAPWAGPHGNTLTPHPTGMVDTTTVAPKDQVVVTLANAPFSKNDPWLPSSATTTDGNNVAAYADLTSPDGFSGADVRAELTAARAFEFTYDATKNPNASAENIKAVTTQLFYITNWMHDWFYDAGFDEASRNHQENNFGRGGSAGDQLLIEAQDYSGRNNANAATPADGGNPRIQMFLFNGQGTATLSVTAPSTIAGTIGNRPAQFGPSNFDVTETVVLVEDGGGVRTDGCEAPFANAASIKGKIALVDRGTCPFTDKVLNAESAGAAGVLIVNNVATGGAPFLGGTEGVTVKTPALGVSLADGDKLKGELMNGVTVRMQRATAPDRDGGLDTSIVSHEWGHVLSNRLVNNGNGLRNAQGGGMGEGFSDFIALLTTVHTSDVAAAAKNEWKGTYPIAGWVYGVGAGTGSYFGMRRYPYSADLTKNPLTFKHIQNGTPLPSGVPIAFGEEGRYNAEVHATGEVWASMLWQCYVGLLRDSTRLTYDEANKRMRTYLVAGLKATPRDPTMIEARDALLRAMYAADQQDFQICAKGFAERGAGTGAKAPPSTSTNNVGVTESFVTGKDFEIVDLALAESTSCDSDGVLDNGEAGVLTMKLRNVGTEDIGAITARVTSKGGHFTFANEGKLTIPAFKPFETVEAQIEVKLVNAAALSKQDLDVEFDASGLATPRTATATLPLVVDYDTEPDSSASDDVEAESTAWRATGAASATWRRVANGINRHWSIPGSVIISDRSLVSPPLTVATDAPLVLTFKHRHAFEQQRGQNFDGGVLEISTDDGATWKDVGGAVYNGTLSTRDSANPLAGRRAFVVRSLGYPAFAPVTLDLGTAYAGRTVRVRFRSGTDEGTASAAWDVDDIAFTGITNTPFASRVPDVTACGAPAVEVDAGAPAGTPPPEEGGSACGCDSAGRTTSTAAGAAALIALALLSGRARQRAVRPDRSNKGSSRGERPANRS